MPVDFAAEPDAESKVNDGLFSSARHDWCTPAEVLDRVYAVDAIQLDPCSGPGSIVCSAQAIMPPMDGLALDWGFGLIFVNSPYGRHIGRWIEKCAVEAACASEIIALVPARTDTGWWHRYATTANAICFWRGRIKFAGTEHPAPFPSALLYWGLRAERFEAAFASAGWLVRL